MNLLTGGIGTMLRGAIVCVASGLLWKPWMIITQFLAGLALIGLGIMKLRQEKKFLGQVDVKSKSSEAK